MTNPRDIVPLPLGVTYQIPTYKITEDGLEDGSSLTIQFCKGDKTNPDVPRQEGVFIESLLQVCFTHLNAINVGDLATRESSIAATHIQMAILMLQERTEQRRQRGVLQTYQK